MPKVKQADNGEIHVSFPGRWVALFAVPALAAMGLTFQSTRAQPEVVERAILVHAQERHKNAASAVDMKEVQIVQKTLNGEVDELRGMVKDLIYEMRELTIELRTDS